MTATQRLIRAAAGVITTGDIAVPTDGVAAILETLSVRSIARRYGARVVTGQIDSQAFSANLSHQPAAAIAEGGSYAESGDVTPVTMNLHKYGGRYGLTEEVAEDTVARLLRQFGESAGLALSRRENIEFLVGNGTTAPAGVFGQAATVVTAGASPTTAELRDLDDALGVEYDRDGVASPDNWDRYRGPVYVMHPATATTIRALDTSATFTDHYQGRLHSMFGRPVILSDDAPEIAAGAKPVVLVNWQGYAIGQRSDLVSIRVGLDEDTHGQTWDYHARIDGKIWDSDAIAVLQIAP